MKDLYANRHAKRKRIAAGSGEKMRKVGSKGAPTAKAFRKRFSFESCARRVQLREVAEGLMPVRTALEPT